MFISFNLFSYVQNHLSIFNFVIADHRLVEFDSINFQDKICLHYFHFHDYFDMRNIFLINIYFISFEILGHISNHYWLNFLIHPKL
jgi:hypothetical protein